VVLVVAMAVLVACLSSARGQRGQQQHLLSPLTRNTMAARKLNFQTKPCRFGRSVSPSPTVPFSLDTRKDSRISRDVVVRGENIFSRVGRLVRSYTNSFISSLEDPEKILDQAVEDMQGDLIKMRQASAQVMASQKQLQQKYTTAKNTADEWYRRAELALRKGEEGLAKEALARKKSFQGVADGLKGQLDAQEKAMNTLMGNVRTLEGKLAEAKSKKDTLKARAASAKTQKQISEMVTGMDTSSALSAFEKMEQKVMALEAESESVAMLAGGDDVDQAFKALESGDSVDDDLELMKKNMKNGATRPVAGTLVPRERETLDMELEQLRRDLRNKK